jgi:hypothetical protein
MRQSPRKKHFSEFAQPLVDVLAGRDARVEERNEEIPPDRFQSRFVTGKPIRDVLEVSVFTDARELRART